MDLCCRYIIAGVSSLVYYFCKNWIEFLHLWLIPPAIDHQGCKTAMFNWQNLSLINSLLTGFINIIYSEEFWICISFFDRIENNCIKNSVCSDMTSTLTWEPSSTNFINVLSSWTKTFRLRIYDIFLHASVTILSKYFWSWLPFWNKESLSVTPRIDPNQVSILSWYTLDYDLFDTE